MGSGFPQLTLDLCPPKPSIPNYFFQFLVPDNSIDLSMINYYVCGLEDEITKLQAFQRELPLSFLLLNDAIRKLKEAAAGKKNEENISEDGGNFDRSVGVKLEFNDFDINKKNWMSSAQLWSPTNEDEPPRRSEERGAILSFTEATEDYVPGLSLVPPGLKSLASDEPGSSKANKTGSVFYTKMNKAGVKVPYQTARKRRRCWSPELHQRFVDALERLGGSQVATPKQIKDLMQVDGLTNDEVKSHLQKYRLHVRKLPAASTTTLLSSDLVLESRDELELDSSTMDLQHSSSPKGPLSGRSKRCNSSSIEEDDEEKSDGHSWKAHNH